MARDGDNAKSWMGHVQREWGRGLNARLHAANLEAVSSGFPQVHGALGFCAGLIFVVAGKLTTICNRDSTRTAHP